MTDLSEISTTDLIKELMNRLAKDQYHLHDIMNRNTSLMNNLQIILETKNMANVMKDD